ncbi:mediator of RNA polymerase II transcription subunit 4-like isoform X2 [Gigantopelta aegis]|uniref:mediator of RNA polymerase II transcription subunit 4-like isoform X2 n=1 Tax=Gigantopelta aegis TaxID=1735272 RepID=UPI001B887B41|nr:mediator of RNA polymerase II transcription subunit 4-like isoform X2 [Gigantopelta aegis]
MEEITNGELKYRRKLQTKRTTMTAPTCSTRQKLLSLIEDIEIISKELFETMSSTKGQPRSDTSDTVSLMELLVEKDNEIKQTLKLEEQAGIQQVIDGLKQDVDRRDIEIKNLQRNLKEAETILATAIYQARQKLQSISQANKKTISSEELIKFAHRISSSNAVAAPVTWAPGDPRRPYPTDLEMRHGFLAQQGSYTDSASSTPRQTQVHSIQSDHNTAGSVQSSSSLSWQPSQTQEIPVPLLSSTPQHTVTEMKGHNKENEEVELMSSDSSDSSSSVD